MDKNLAEHFRTGTFLLCRAWPSVTFWKLYMVTQKLFFEFRTEQRIDYVMACSMP